MRNRHLHYTFKASVLAAALAALPSFVGAAGLGKITVLSALGQPLRAEVDLTASREELSGLKAQLAAADAFRQAGIEYAPVLAGIRVTVGQRPGGQSYLRLTSDRPVNDPFVDLLLEVTWAQGRLQREYTFLLDPAPEAMSPRPAAIAPSAAKREPATVTKPVAPQAQSEVTAAPPAEQAAAKPKAEKAEAAGEREVKKGDTLRKIASETRYEGVSLDQMLVAILRGNKDAFAGNNMNRLKAGRILSIPDRDAVASVAEADAHRIVVAQAADFNAYRRKLAAAAAGAEATGEEAPQQAVSGKITAKVEDKIPAPAETQDQLKVSRAEAAKESKALQGKIAALEEEGVAKEKALKEANSRLAELEKNVKDLQKLVELKNQNLAELQKQAAATKGAPTPEAKKPEAGAPAPTPEAPKSTEKPAEVVAAAAPPAAEKPAELVKPAEAVPPAAPQPQAAAPAAEQPAALPKAAVPKKPAPPPPPSEPSFFDELMDNPLVLAGGAVILGLLGFLGYRQRQKGKQHDGEPSPTTTSVNLATNSVFGSTGGQSVDTSASSLQTDFSQASISAIDADEGVDPVAEADVYMAYGRDAQAEEILLDALKNDPSRTAIHAKLLEIYAARKSLKQFETLASELYAQTGGVGADWEKAAALGLKLDPSNPLFGGKAAEEGAAAPSASMADATIIVSSPEKLKDTWTMPGELGQIASAVENQGGAATVILDKAAVEAAGAGAEPAPALDFDLDLGAPPVAEPKPAEPAPVVAEAPASLDFDLGAEFSARETRSAGAPDATATVPLDLDFKLPDAQEAPAASAGDAGLHFDLDLSPAKGTRPAGAVDLETTIAGGGALDFDFNLGEPRGEAPQPPTVDLSAISLDLNQPEIRIEAPAAGGEEEQEVATKLELAKAYEEMGDKEGARELLQEVMKEGDVEQQRKARDMLSALV